MEDLDYFDNEEALAELLKEGILFANCRRYESWNGGEFCSPTIVLFVIINDVFAWGCADAEDITLQELPELYRLYKEFSWSGVVRWACLKRNEQPQKPVKESLIKNGAWDAKMETLPVNRYDGG